MEHNREQAGYQQRAQSLAEAVEKQQSASRDANHWQEVLSATEDRNERRYVEGLVRISTLKALHHNLVAQSCQRDGRPEAKIETAPAVAVATSASEIVVARNSKSEALALLADCYRAFGNHRVAGKYDEAAVTETADDKPPRLVESPAAGRREHHDLQSSYQSLQAAERHLEDYNRGYTSLRNHVRRAVESEKAIQRLETVCSNRPESGIEHRLLKDAIGRCTKLRQLAETEASQATAAYKRFVKEAESAEKAYCAIARRLEGKDAGTPPFEKADKENPVEVSGSKAPESRQSRVMVGLLIRQTLKEIDREL